MGDIPGPGDPGSATVTVPGWVRLVIETVVLAGGMGGFVGPFGETPGITYVVVILAHYAVAWERVGRLMERWNGTQGWGTQGDVISAAAEIADRDGLDQLTLAKVAGVLGIRSVPLRTLTGYPGCVDVALLQWMRSDW